jgi:branched-chain amino acid transport system substrate-binding protein
MKIAGLLMFINDIHSLGLKNTEGLLMTDSWYWDMNDDTRKFAKRFFGKMKKMPSSLQAADYSASALPEGRGSRQDRRSDKVMAELKKMKINDFYARATSAPTAATSTTCT